MSPSLVPDQARSDNAEVSAVHAHILPCIPGYFSGVGDLFSSLVLAHFDFDASPENTDIQSTPLSRAASFALSKTFAVLRRTHDLCTLPGDGEEESLATDEERDKRDPERRVTRMRRRELRLIESQDILRASPKSAARKDSVDEQWDCESDDRDYVRLRELQLWPTFWSQQ